MAPTKLTPDDVDWRKITFRECGVHPGLLFACEACPVCAAEERQTKLLGKIFDQENQIASLEMSRATAAAE